MMQEQSIGILSILILIGSVQGFSLFVALVFMRRGNRRANLYLAALLLTLSVLLVDGFMNISHYYSRYPRLPGIAWPGNFLLGPFLYFYVRELSLPSRSVFSWTHLLHFLPMTVSALLIFYHVIAYGYAPEWAAACCVVLAGAQMHARDVALFPVVLQINIYWILSFLLVMAYSARIKQSFSSLDKISLSWLRTLLPLFFILSFLYLFFVFFSAHFGIQREIVSLLYLSVAVISSVMAFKGLLQPELFSRIEAAHQTELSRTDPVKVSNLTVSGTEKSLKDPGAITREKYQTSWLTEERAAEIARQLLQLMETKKPYLEPELTLPELADKLAVFPHHLSQVINQEMKKNFFDFINEYRVQETKRLLSSPLSSHLSILGIALDAGFNSKSAFYIAFSKYAGMKPSEFRKQLKTSE